MPKGALALAHGIDEVQVVDDARHTVLPSIRFFELPRQEGRFRHLLLKFLLRFGIQATQVLHKFPRVNRIQDQLGHWRLIIHD
jgi:hypothetical protein